MEGSIWGPTRPPRNRVQDVEVLKEYPSHSSDTIHQVRKGSDGKIYCTCQGWKFKRWCCHLEDYLKEDINENNKSTS